MERRRLTFQDQNFTGNRKTRPEWLTLEDEFFKGEDSFINVKVKVLYDGKKGDIINQYVAFTKVYNEQVRRYGRIRKAVLETIRICKEEDILVEYLESRKKEVVDIMMTLFDQEYAVERYGDEQRAEGKIKQAKETAIRLKKKGFSFEDIAETVNFSVETIKEWLSPSVV